MNPNEFTKQRTGRILRDGAGFWSFIPNPLPRELDFSPSVVKVLSAADRKIGRLDGLCRRLANPHLLSGAYVRREAVLSSRIEGTQSTQADLYLFELDPEENSIPHDTREVANYVSALDYGLNRLASLPLSLRLIREMHAKLMEGVRGRDKSPGEFRTSQNWIGGRTPADARYVPPPVNEMWPALDDLEKFLHRAHPEAIPPLIELALVHYQFEAIHPFLDGNGRLGRLLITLLAIERQCIGHPLLYLSAYFERKRDDYYDHLLNVSHTGDLKPWLEYFLMGVMEQAEDAMLRAEKALDIYAEYTSRNLSATARKLIDILFENPIITKKTVSTNAQVSPATAMRAVEELLQQHLLSPMDARQRGRRYVATQLLDLFTADLSSEYSSH